MLACVAVMLAGVGIRAFIHTRSPITPAIDGAYYAIQPRSLLVHGTLDYPDMPVKFVMDAVLAKVLQGTLGLALDQACMRASQVTDCLLPPLLAVPIFLLAALVARSRTALCIATGTAAMLVLGGPAIRMTADFQKNALALVFAAAMLQQACVALEAWQREAGPVWRPTLACGACLAMTALTHAGTGAVAALNLALVAVAALVWLPTLRRRWTGRAGLIACMGIAAGVGLTWFVLQRLDPARAMRILETPLRVLSPSEGGTLRQPGPPGMGGRWMPFAVATAMGALCAWMQSRRGTHAPTWSKAAGVGCVLTAALITLPVFDGDSGNRLALVAMLPGAVAFTLAFAGGPSGLRGVWPAVAALLVALASAPGAVRFASRPCVDPASLEELRTMRDLVPEHRRALLVARHGLEFWANWAMDVNTRQSGIPADAFDRYDRVLVLTEVRGHGPMRGPRPPDGEGSDPDDGEPPFGRMPPPGEGPGGGLRGVRLPRGSRLLFQGSHYRLFEVPREAVDGEDEDRQP